MSESQSLRLPDKWGREVAAKVAQAIRGACGREADKNADMADQIDDACDAAVTATMQVLAEEFNGRDPVYDATALAEAEARGRRQGLEWRPIETAPKDGTPIWAYLYDSGIREVSWWSAEAIAEDMGGRPEEYQEGFYEGRSQDEWCARWWLPLDALPSAPDCATATAETQKPETGDQDA